MPSTTVLGQAGLQGWREKVADMVAPRLAGRAPIEEEHVRAVIGAVFFALSVSYIVKTVRAALRDGT